MPCAAVEMSSSDTPIWFWVFSPVGRSDSGSRSGDHVQGPVERFMGRLMQAAVQRVRSGQKSGPTVARGSEQRAGVGSEGGVGAGHTEELTQEAAKGDGR